MNYKLFRRINLKTQFTVFFVFTFLFLNLHSVAYAQKLTRDFVVVLDAGHGGRDPGNLGNGFKEAEIALNTTLKVGKILENTPGIKLIYTRKTDKYLTLKQRADIANKAEADLFVSIHLNSVSSSKPYGAETFVLGTYRNQDNLEIAMRENKVILLEEDYQSVYDGFEPENPASYIGMILMQEEYHEQSIMLADFIQKEFVHKLKRLDRGVKAAGFLVLRETVMPSVLVEMGFLTNKKEGTYLNSAKGQSEMAKAIADGIIKYKNELNLHATEVIMDDLANLADGGQTFEGVEFCVQIAAGSKALETAAYNFKGLQGVEREKEGNLYKYFYGRTRDYNRVQNHLKQAKEKGYTSAYIVAFKNGKKISLNQVLKENKN